MTRYTIDWRKILKFELAFKEENFLCHFILPGKTVPNWPRE